MHPQTAFLVYHPIPLPAPGQLDLNQTGRKQYILKREVYFLLSCGLETLFYPGRVEAMAWRGRWWSHEPKLQQVALMYLFYMDKVRVLWKRITLN